jgi:hypothetical protein
LETAKEVLLHKERLEKEGYFARDEMDTTCCYAVQDKFGVTDPDRKGSQYTSYAFQNLAKEKGIITSMSRKGNCLDNAVIESFHSTIKSEEFYSQPREYLTNPIVVEFHLLLQSNTTSGKIKL